MLISSRTKVCLVIGDPVEHSLSPKLHNAAYQAVGLERDFIYVAAKVSAPDLAAAVAGFRAMFRGMSVTIPHKERIISYLDQLDEAAKGIGAVNTVVNNNGVLQGINTDWSGLVTALSRRVLLKDKKVLVLGAGGTARAAVYGLKRSEADVTVCNRTESKGQGLAKEFGVKFLDFNGLSQVGEYQIILNTTPIGLESVEESIIEAKYLKPQQVVMDVVYKPFETRLLQDAKLAGCTIVRGAEMFLYQAMEQFVKYTGCEAPESVMRAVLCEEFAVQNL
jgi:shikimate dehydrogenase